MKNFILIFLSFWFVGCQDTTDVIANASYTDMVQSRSKTPNSTLIATFPDGHTETFVVSKAVVSYVSSGVVSVVLDDTQVISCAGFSMTNATSDLCVDGSSISMCDQYQVNVQGGLNNFSYALNPAALTGTTTQIIIEEMDGM